MLDTGRNISPGMPGGVAGGTFSPNHGKRSSFLRKNLSFPKKILGVN